MSDAWQIKVYDRNRECYETDVSGPVELGRQASPDEEPFTKHPRAEGGWRVVIAPPQETVVSRCHALVEPLAADKVRLTNRSNLLPIHLGNGSVLETGASCDIALPLLITLGAKTVRIQREEALQLQSLPESTTPPGQLAGSLTSFASLALPRGAGMEMGLLLRWLQTTMGVLQSAATSEDFFAKAAQALVDIVGLDAGRVLLLEEEWSEKACRTAAQVPDGSAPRPSRLILRRVREEKKTFWYTPDSSSLDAPSLKDVKGVVAAPILNRHNEVVGALYGDRFRKASPAIGSITKLEAMLVDILATSVAAGLARLEQERKALEARVRFEQFFTPELARQLVEHPEHLEGRDVEVTILICDIRNFSRISEHLGPQPTVQWISEVMGVLSDCVLSQGGVLVEYVGDELMAMWGAPLAQDDQAARAGRAALEMLAQLPKLNERWQETLKCPMDVGIGINSGLTRVGNVGSSRKLKYGPLGMTVNLASRVQGAAKYLKCRLLITEATKQQLGAEFVLRRLCTVRVVNMVQDVNLYELMPARLPNGAELKATYEKALEEFEKQDFRQAARDLVALVAHPSNDGPSLVLMSRAVNALVEEPEKFDPVWELPGK